MSHQTVRTIAVGIIAGAVAIIGVTVIKDRYFAAAFMAVVMLAAQRIGGEA